MISLELFEELYRKVDYSAIDNEDVLFEEASGMKYVNMIVEKHFDYVSDEYFFEYSTIASTINIHRKELYCFSAIKGSDYFKKRLYRYAQPVIKEVFNDAKRNWFHNPQLFIAPSINTVYPFVSKKNTTYPDLLKIGVDIDKIIARIDGDSLNVNQPHAQISSDGSLYILDLRYDRSFELILESSKSIFKEYEGDENLLTASYHNGAELLRACYDRILDVKDEEKYYYLTFPIISARNSQASEMYSSLYSKEEMANRVQGTGHFFIYFKVGNNVTDDELKRRIDSLYCEMNLVLNFLSLNYIFNSALDLYTQSRKEAIKSAISAIMARNMSHNLGSHFISNTKHYFSNLAENDTDEQRQKDYRGIRHTLQYIQERMDFIATIVSTDRFPYGPVNVKSQIFDELTPDEFGDRHGKATTNFLLDYIVFSEDISKQTNLSSNNIKLSLKLISDSGRVFGGQENENQEAKEEFAKLNLAVPGGILGRHAIFTIIENVIRNSAKHDKESIPEDGLTVSIKIGEDHLVIFDNKKNANKEIKKLALKEELNERYAQIKILSDGAIDKSNKGLKEILISALWLNNHSLADWFGEYESIPNKDKIEKLSDVLRVVAVDDNGDMTDDGENLGYYIALDKYKEVYYIKDDMVVDDKINYSSINRIKADIIVANKDYEVLIDGNARQNEDAGIDSNGVLRLSNLYPRFYENRGGGELPQIGEMMKAIIVRNTGITIKELNDINVHIEPKDYTLLSYASNINHCIWHATGEATGIRKNDILFKNHLSTLNTEGIDRVLAAYSDAAYIDSISGGDFTGTITQSFFLQDEFNCLKVIESALTEFVIIDERIFKNYGHGVKKTSAGSEPETNELLLDADKIFNEVEELLALGKSCDNIGDDIGVRYDIELHVATLMKNDKVLIREDIEKKVAQKNSESAPKTERTESNSDNFIALHKMIERRKLHIYDIDKNGNVTNLEGENVASVIDRNGMKTLCSPTFLSIHLSIIEKITKENNNMKASEVMNNLKTIFGGTKFVTIHSGRGNLSAELEKELKDYAFLSLSAIQAAMDDSKYFLSQLLYNNCYIGKGRLNHK